MTSISTVQLKKYYVWRHKIDWILAPIHTQANLDAYLKATAQAGSPLDALSSDAKQRFLSSLVFGRHGLGSFSTADLQYLTTPEVYRILSLFGVQSYTMMVTGGRFRTADNPTRDRLIRSSPIERDFDEYLKKLNSTRDMPIAKRSTVAGNEYEKLFSSKQESDKIGTAGKSDLRLLLRAATKAASATHNAKYADDARMDLLQMIKRDFAEKPDYEQVYRALVETRQFGAARKFYLTNKTVGLAPFPVYLNEVGNVDKNTPTVLEVSASKHELIRRRADLDKPAQIVILTDPNCHFCAYFDQAFQSRPKLHAVLQRDAILVAPPGSELEFDTLQRWNNVHPRMPIAIIYNLQGWPMIKHLSVPRFFFLQHGKVVAKHVGWPRGGAFPALESDLKKIGLWK